MTSPRTSAEIGALYQEMILDHYRRPRNKGALDKADATVEMKNPLCGDEITLQVAFEGDSVCDLRFSGRGCSISQASASMMTQLVKGKSTEEVSAIRKQFRELMLGNPSADDAQLGSLRALSGVARFPARVKCALL
ncbi:MAG TPA: SUF system NifU family Fe-S cluster assembly protein, partial [Gemmatimonadaceae bacterium]|nr:SUF system NifU family Fe-S cluster assembly protein [Gemmatimonadaceae bacterium]